MGGSFALARRGRRDRQSRRARVWNRHPVRHRPLRARIRANLLRAASRRPRSRMGTRQPARALANPKRALGRGAAQPVRIRDARAADVRPGYARQDGRARSRHVGSGRAHRVQQPTLRDDAAPAGALSANPRVLRAAVRPPTRIRAGGAVHVVSQPVRRVADKRDVRASRLAGAALSRRGRHRAARRHPHIAGLRRRELYGV